MKFIIIGLMSSLLLSNSFSVSYGDKFLLKNECSILEINSDSFNFSKKCFLDSDKVVSLSCTLSESNIICIDSYLKKSYISYFDYVINNSNMYIQSMYLEMVVLEYENK